MSRERKKDEHPAYGVIGFYRTQGDPGKMFGSAMPQHGHFITMSVKRAVRYHDGYDDWVHGTGEELINIWLSAAQFAELLTTMNVGDGVPCTIKRYNGEGIEEMPPAEKTEAERVHDSIETKMRVFASTFQEKTDLAKKMLLGKGTISVGSRKQVAWILDWLHMELVANMPFHAKMFTEAIEKTTVAAKEQEVIEVYGASDDLVEITGDIREEFSHYVSGPEPEPLYLAFSDGTALSVVYDHDGVWRINQVAKGSADYEKTDGVPDSSGEDYTDRVKLHGSIEWVIRGSEMVRKP